MLLTTVSEEAEEGGAVVRARVGGEGEGEGERSSKGGGGKEGGGGEEARWEEGIGPGAAP